MRKGQLGPTANRLEYSRCLGTGRHGAPRLTYKPDWNTGCWNWLLGKDPGGYGQFRFNGKKDLAHRIFYTQLIGPIPAGLDIDHLCRNRACVNPLHMEPVTRQVNTIRGVGPAARHAAATHCKRGHPFDEENTYWRSDRPFGRGRTCRTCGRERPRRPRRGTV